MNTHDLVRQNMLPEEKAGAFTRALEGAFGVSTFDDIGILTGGHTSSLVFRVVTAGTPYLLKVILRTEDPTRHFTCMKAAAQAGIAPAVRYASVEDRVFVSDYVRPQRLSQAEALVRMPRLLRALHALPPFPTVPDPINTSCMFLLRKGPAWDAVMKLFHDADMLPKAEREELVARLERIAAVYPLDESDMVSSHNDLFKPDNAIFDGSRVWLVDWEAAFLNDRYPDLVVVANLIASGEAEERLFLTEYFGAEPTEEQLARFDMVRQLVHIFYTMAFLMTPAPLPDFRGFQKSMWEGRVDLADKQTKALYGKVHWHELKHRWR